MTKTDTSKKFVSLPIGSPVAVQCKDGGPWTLGMIEGKSGHNHHDRSYNVHITDRKTSHMNHTTYKTNTDITRTISP